MKKIDGVECYGKLEDDSNFELVCEDEEHDGVWCNGNPDSPDFTFDSWEQVVETLKAYYDATIIEIHAV